MDSFKFYDVRAEKANAISRYRRVGRITTLLRFVELCVFLVVVSRFSSQFAFSMKLPGEFFWGISVSLIGPRFVFLIGNAIVVVLFLKSGRFASKNGDDFYEEYVEKCRKNQDAYEHKYDLRKMQRSQSENLERTAARGEEHRRELRRSATDGCRRGVGCGRKAAASGGGSYAEDKMSSEEFRRTVEAFIARQQRFLREEEEFSAVGSLVKY